MRKITFCRNGEKISDFETEQWVNNFIASDKIECNFSNHLAMDVFRVKVKTKEINVDEYEFFVENLTGNISRFNIDKDGRSHDWVDSQDIWSTLVMKLI